MINNPNRIVRPNEKQFFGQSVDQYKFLRLGRITRVDNEQNYVSVLWLDSPGGFHQLPISSGFASPRGFLGGMPSVGSVVICGYSKQTQTTGRAVILSYVTSGYRSSLWYLLDRGNFEETKNDLFEDAVSNETYDAFIKEKINHEMTRYKRRKLYSGEIHGESDQGSEIFLDDNVTLTGAGLEEFIIRSSDHHIISNSLNNTVITGACKIKNGIITRNLDEDGIAVSKDITTAPFQQHIVLPNGKKLFVVTTDYKDINSTDTESLNQSGGGAFTEHRIEMYETSPFELKVTEETSETEINTKPFVTHVLGTNVGNDYSDRTTYGKILRPRIFKSPEDKNASVGDEVVANEISRFKTLATCFELKFKSTTKISIDKQGHAFINLAASNNEHPLGAGRSLELNSEGGWKLVIGANVEKKESILLHTKGGNRFYFGSNAQKRSVDAVLDSALYMTIKAGDESGTAMSTSIVGNVVETIKGNKTINIDGNYKIIVTGVIDERIKATKMETFVKDKYTNYGGNFVNNILGKSESNIATSNSISISGDLINSNNFVDKKTIVSGSKRTNITKGNLEENLSIGNRKLNIITGNDVVSITSGDYKVDVTTGSISIKTAVGSVTLSGSTDVKISGMNVTLDAEATNKLIAGVLASIESSLIHLGKDATQPGVLGFQLLSWLASHTHLHHMGPTLQPTIPPSIDMLSKIVFLK